MKRVLLLLTLCSAITVNAQIFTESFADGDFTANPVWSSTQSPPHFGVVANSPIGAGDIGSFTLLLDAPGGSGGTVAYISTPNSTWGSFQSWVVWMARRGVAASNAEQNRVWLFANEADVTSLTVDGYRLVFGDDTGGDEVILERVVNGVANATIVLSSTAVVNGRTQYGFRVRVTRNATNQWQIFTGVDLSTMVGGGELPSANPFSITGNASPLTTELGTTIPITGTGYFALAALHGASGPQRLGAAYDNFHFEANGILPVTFTSFNVIIDNNKARLTWKVAAEQNVDGYEVERSNNGVQFSKLGFVKATGSSSYSFTDEKILNGVNFYRVKNVDLDGKFAYTHIVSINGKKGQFVKLFPIPARTDLFIQHHDAIKGAQLKISSMEGRIVRIISVPSNATQTIINLSTIHSGVYFVTYDSGDGNKLTSKFIKQ